MTNIKTNMLPNAVFMLVVIIVPACFIAIASVGIESDILKMLAR